MDEQHLDHVGDAGELGGQSRKHSHRSAFRDQPRVVPLDDDRRRHVRCRPFGASRALALPSAQQIAPPPRVTSCRAASGEE